MNPSPSTKGLKIDWPVIRSTQMTPTIEKHETNNLELTVLSVGGVVPNPESLYSFTMEGQTAKAIPVIA